MQTTAYTQNEIHRLSEGSWDALCALKRSPSCPSADHALRRQRSLHDSNNCASSSPCSCNTIQSHSGELYAMASSNTASVPRSREQSIMDESIDFSQVRLVLSDCSVMLSFKLMLTGEAVRRARCSSEQAPRCRKSIWKQRSCCWIYHLALYR